MVASKTTPIQNDSYLVAPCPLCAVFDLLANGPSNQEVEYGSAYEIDQF